MVPYKLKASNSHQISPQKYHLRASLTYSRFPSHHEQNISSQSGNLQIRKDNFLSKFYIEDMIKFVGCNSHLEHEINLDGKNSQKETKNLEEQEMEQQKELFSSEQDEDVNSYFQEDRIFSSGKDELEKQNFERWEFFQNDEQSSLKYGKQMEKKQHQEKQMIHDQNEEIQNYCGICNQRYPAWALIQHLNCLEKEITQEDEQREQNSNISKEEKNELRDYQNREQTFPTTLLKRERRYLRIKKYKKKGNKKESKKSKKRAFVELRTKQIPQKN